MAISREIVEGGQEHGVDEEVAYTIATTPWGTDPTDVSIEAYDTTDLSVDVSSTVLSGSLSVAGDVITTPKIVDLTLGHTYRFEVLFHSGSNIFEFFFTVKCER